MRYYILKIILFLIFTFSYPNFSFSENKDKVKAIELIYSSENSLKNLISNSELVNLKKYLKNARAILIFPELYEGGLVFGAKGGNGILLIKRSNKEYSGPFFYSIGGLSFGLQIGVIACGWGMTTKGGAKEVGTSTTGAVVMILVSVALMDVLLTQILFG